MANNSTIVQEVIGLSTVAPQIGKFVLAFFEDLLKKLINNDKELEKDTTLWMKKGKWDFLWNPFFEALQSQDEALRTSVCTHITPILLKLNSNVLKYVLSQLTQLDVTSFD